MYVMRVIQQGRLYSGVTGVLFSQLDGVVALGDVGKGEPKSKGDRFHNAFTCRPKQETQDERRLVSPAVVVVVLKLCEEG